MKIKNCIAAGICLILCLAVFYLIFAFLEKNNALFLVLPKSIVSSGIDIDSIEEFSKNEFLLTYEIPFLETVNLAYGNFPVTVIGTTGSYPGILGLTMLEGSFFLNQAWTGKLMYAVLNEKAADTIFGSTMITGSRFRIQNDTWLVSGVIKDGNDREARIYVPSSVTGGKADALALAISGRLDEFYVINSLRTLGVWEKDFDFVNFNAFSRIIKERFLVIFLLFLSFFLFSLVMPLVTALKQQIFSLRKDITHFYPDEIFKYRRKSLYKTFLSGLSLILVPVLSLFLILRIVSICLPWKDIVSLSALNRTFFSVYLDWVHRLEIVSFFLFLLFLFALVVVFVSINIIINFRSR